MALEILSGLPGAGKTTYLIRQLQKAEKNGADVHLFLCSESPELKSRPHVKEGGQMGCRTPGVNFTIRHFVSTDQAIKLLNGLGQNAVAAFDESAWFKDKIVDAWIGAEKRGVSLYVSSLSDPQLNKLKKESYKVSKYKHQCMLCGSPYGEHSITCTIPDRIIHLIVCDACNQSISKNKEKPNNLMLPEKDKTEIIEHLKRMKPFPDEEHAYQPLIDINLPGWDYVRGDSPIRADIIFEILQQAYPSLLENKNVRPSYIDMGCCTGYFCEYFVSKGYQSSGVDIDKDFIDLANKYTQLRGSDINYDMNNFVDYIEAHPDQKFDVVSSFATIQWVMAQSGLEAGLQCFDWLFKSTQKMCILEMGYTDEDIYKDKLPVVINKKWVIDTMNDRGNFDQVIVIEKGTRGLWRDLFVGLIHPEQDVINIDEAISNVPQAQNGGKSFIRKIVTKLKG